MLLFAFSTVLLVAVDQITKHAAQKQLRDSKPLSIIDGVFELCYLENRGSAFGILQGQKTFFIITAVLVLIAVPYIYAKIPLTKRFWYLRVIAVLFLSGAVGNAVDRVLHGYVIDFYYFSFIDFPIFNMADIYVTVATFAMILLILFYYEDDDFQQIHLFSK